MKTIVLTLAATASLLGIAGVASAQSTQNQSPAAGRQCTVTVDRSRDAGVFDVTRQELSDGSCVCYAYTGPEQQGISTENQIRALLEGRSCNAARVVQVPGEVAAGGGGGASGDALVAIAGGAAIAGTIAGLAQSNEDNVSASP